MSAAIHSGITGTDNPRHLCVIQALMTRPLTREYFDQVAGCSNGPELVAQLRCSELKAPCSRIKNKGRDLFDCFPDVFHFTKADLRSLLSWVAKRGGAT